MLKTIQLFFFLQLTAFAPLCAQSCQLSETYANTLCTDIFRVLGGKGATPKVFFKSDDNLASSSVVGGRAQIHIDPNKVIKILEDTFGTDCKTTDADDALAVILGHEIWHILTKKQGVRFGFWTSQDYQTRHIELEADVHGLIGAYFAGKTRCMAIYHDIFKSLHLDASANYPGIIERQRMEQQVRERAEGQFRLYDAANCLLASNRRDAQMLAIHSYQHIGNRFHFLKEINFNMGLANLLLALGDLKVGALFPIEPAANPLADLVARASGGNASDTEGFLRDATQYFQDAQKQDPDYFEAWLGQISVDLLRHAYAPANRSYTYNVFDAGQKWQKQHPEVRLSQLQSQQLKMLEAIAYLLQIPAKDQAKAQKLLSDIEDDCGGTYLCEYARYNRRLAGTTGASDTPRISAVPAPKLSEIDGISHDVAALYETLKQENGWQSIAMQLDMYQMPLKNSDLIFFQQKKQYLAVQFYHKCPSVVGKTNIPAQKNTAPGNYHFLEGPSYDVVTWTESDGTPRCAKMLRAK